MRSLINILVVLLLAIFISGCTESVEHNKEIKEKKLELVDDDILSTETTYHFTYKGQEFKIISFFDEILEYARTISENPELEKKAVYSEHVLEPFLEKSSINEISLGDMLRPSWQIEQLEKKTHELLEKQDQINKWIEEGILKSAELLPGEDINIYIFPVNPEEWHLINTGGGISGMTFSENDVVLMIDPSVLEERVNYTVAHEYHHTVNFLLDGIPIDSNIFDFVLTEGKADVFASIVYPNIKAFWKEPLSNEEETNVLEELRVHGESRDYLIYDKLVYGNSRKDIPKFSNYKIGYQITESFIENNPNSPIIEWTKLGSQEIISKSKYSDLLP